MLLTAAIVANAIMAVVWTVAVLFGFRQAPRRRDRVVIAVCLVPVLMVAAPVMLLMAFALLFDGIRKREADVPSRAGFVGLMVLQVVMWGLAVFHAEIASAVPEPQPPPVER